MINNMIRQNRLYKNNIRDENIIFMLIGILFFRIALEITFFNFVLVYYENAYIYVKDLSNYVLSWVMLFITFFPLTYVIRRKSNNVSGTVTFWLYLFAFVPSNVLSGLMYPDISYILSLTTMWFLLLSLVGITRRYVGDYNYIEYLNSHKKHNDINKVFFLLFIGICLLLTFMIIFKYNRFNFDFSFDDIYGTREEASTAFSTFESLVLVIMPTIIIPIILPIFIKENNYYAIILLIITQIMIFMVGANKYYLIVLLGGILIYCFYSQKLYMHVPILLAIFIVFANLLLHFDQGKFVKDILMDLGIRRMFFAPAQISCFYFDFFQDNPTLWLCEHPLFKRLGYIGPYNGVPIADIVMFESMGEKGANNGTFGNAFAEFGYWGIVLYPIIYYVVLKIIDKFTNNISPRLYGMLALSMATSLLNTSIVGIEFTYILFVVLLYSLYSLYSSYKITRRQFLEPRELIITKTRW